MKRETLWGDALGFGARSTFPRDTGYEVVVVKNGSFLDLRGLENEPLRAQRTIGATTAEGVEGKKLLQMPSHDLPVVPHEGVRLRWSFLSRTYESRRCLSELRQVPNGRNS